MTKQELLDQIAALAHELVTKHDATLIIAVDTACNSNEGTSAIITGRAKALINTLVPAIALGIVSQYKQSDASTTDALLQIASSVLHAEDSVSINAVYSEDLDEENSTP